MRSTGNTFEDLALAHAMREGLSLVTRNFTSRYGELDLVMRDREVVVFLEVRYRKSEGFGGALASVGAAKRERLSKAASLFLQANPTLAHHPCRFDVMAISGSAETPNINWQRNAFDTA